MTDVIDDTNVDVTGKDQGPNPDDGVKPGDSPTPEKLPFDDHPKWKEMAGKGKEVDEILESYGYDSLEELQESLTDSTVLKEALGDFDVDNLEDVLKKASTLDKYEAYWAAQDEQNRQEDLEPDERVKELEVENLRLQGQRKHDEDVRKQAIDAEHTIKDYEKGISSSIKEDKDVPDFAKSYVTKYLGVNHPMNDIADDRLADPKEIAKMADIAKKDINILIGAAITAYRDGKLAIPDISPTVTSPVTGENKIKNLKDAEKAFTEILMKKLHK